MKNLNSNVFTKSIRKNNIFLVLSLLFLFITIVLFYLGYKNENKKLPELADMNSLIDSNNFEENVYAYIDVNTKPYLFASYNTDGVDDINKFYLVMDEKANLYVLYMSQDNYNNLNINSVSSNPIRISGVTKKINNDIKKLAITSYNDLMENEYLNEENFEDYVGLIYLDTEVKLNDSTIYYIGVFLTFILFLIFVIIYLNLFIKNKKVLKKFTQSELEQINIEIGNQKSNNPYEKMKLNLLKNYIVDTANNIVILEYKDIIWAYAYEYRYNGLLINKCIKIMTKDKKIYDISNTKFLDKKKDEVIEEILSMLKEKNSDVLLGYNKENRKTIKEKYKK